MKLGEMQRFKYIPRTHTIEGEYGGYFDRADDGDFVRFSDHQSSLAEREQRIAKGLSAAVKALYFADNSDYGSFLWEVVAELGGPEATQLLESDEQAAFDKYCAALAATEGEKREHNG